MDPEKVNLAQFEDLDEVLAKCILDLKVTCGIIFPDIFYADFSTLHQQIFDLINSGARKIAIAAPRGIGKTSIARAMAMSCLLYTSPSPRDRTRSRMPSSA